MSAPQGSPFATVDARDLEHYHAQPGNWNVRATQLGRGSFRSRIRSLKFPGLTVYDNKWGASSLIRGKAPDSILMLGGVRKRSPLVHWCGEVPDQSRFACTAGGQEIEFSVERNVHDIVLLIDPELLGNACGALAVETLQTQRHVDFEPAAAQSLIDAALTLLDRGPAAWTLPDDSLISQDARAMLLGRLERCFATVQDLPASPVNGRVRKAAFQAAVAHVSAVRLNTSAFEMALAAGVSQKTLEHVFLEQLGMTPARYLKIARLNMAHRRLREGEPEKSSVTEIALRCGFSHPGRFSSEYRQLFGELPSDTLAKR